MAFVKVVRRSMRPEEYTALRFDWLSRYIYKEKTEITGIEIRDARQVDEHTYEYDNDWHPLTLGEDYFTPDGTVFFRAKASIPEHLRGQELWMSLWTAAEVIVKVNGKYIGGFDPNRDRILLSPYINSDELDIEMEGYNRSKPDDERNPDSMKLRGCRQTFNGLFLSTIRKEVRDLYYDVALFLDITNSEYFSADYIAFLNTELNNALNFIDFDVWREKTDLETGLLALSAEEEAELLEQVKAASNYIEKVIYANDDFKGSGNVALIGHSHLDIAYYWRRIHTVEKNARTVLIQMRLMDQYPDYHYTHTQPYVYELLEKYYPDLFEEMKEKIKAGNFEPVGAMYVEPDCNIPSAESFIRQLLYGQQYYQSRFGFRVNTCWLPDVFGNSWILPQIMRKSGVEYFISNKMSTWNDTNRFPHNNFIWKGIDGSQIYACVPPTHFITWNDPAQIQENWEAYQDKEKGGQTLSMFGYGDGGSGATEEMIELMHRFPKVSAMPKTEEVTATQFLDNNFKGNDKLAVWDGELYLEMHRGTFTTKGELKNDNRRLENLMRDVEIVNVLRNLAGEEYPADKILDTYKLIMVNQFHDILPGSHIHPVFEDAVKDYAKAFDYVAELLGEGDSYMNTLNFDRSQITFVADENGKEIYKNQKGDFVLPAMKAFEVNAEVTKGDCEQSSWISIDGNTVETDHYIVKFDTDGSIISLYDKDNDREWADGAMNKLHVYLDMPGTYDAWDILPNYKEKEDAMEVVSAFALEEQDDTHARFSVTLKTKSGKSTWKQYIRLFAGSRAIDVEHEVDWHETHRLAKAEFGINVLSRTVTCDTSAGFIERATHQNTTWEQARFETNSHKWFDLSETDGGVAVINDSKYGIGPVGNHITLSLLRSTMRPDIESDRGIHRFSYEIVPHAGSHIDAKIGEMAIEYNEPILKTKVPTVVPNRMQDILAAITKENTGMILQALKKSEDGKSIVVRLSEQDGRRGSFNLPVACIEANMLEDAESEKMTHISYAPFEIKTLLFEV